MTVGAYEMARERSERHRLRIREQRQARDLDPAFRSGRYQCREYDLADRIVQNFDPIFGEPRWTERGACPPRNEGSVSSEK